MTWIEPKYSKSAVRKAGDILRNPSASKEELVEALTIVNNWRASHAFPLNSLQGLLRFHARKIDSDALISQRLKRLPSVRSKLERFPKMRLNQMQDIGGCRAIMPDVNKVDMVKNYLLESKTKNILIKESNYIENPKDSGYRGIHLIYRYGSENNDIYSNHFIEIQIRTRLQHAWATTVEIAGTFLKTPLKSSEGPDEWLRFFYLASILFSGAEAYIPAGYDEVKIKEVKKEVTKLVETLSIFDKLKAFSVWANFIGDSNSEADYFLLLLDINKEKVLIASFQKEELNFATAYYADLEKEHKDNANVDIVLVAAESIKNLRKAYPNYFADSQSFLQTLNAILNYPGI